MENEVTEEYLVDYYFKFKELVNLHKTKFPDCFPSLPVLFTEALCRHIYQMKKSNIKDYDALRGNKKIEIKATSNKSGRTTINLASNFDVLYWLYFNYEKDKLIVTKMPRERFKDEKSLDDNKRDNITLANKKKEDDKVDVYKITKENAFVKQKNKIN